MNRLLRYFIIILFFIVLIGCQQGNEDPLEKVKEERARNAMDIYEFTYIKKAPEAKNMHSIDEVIKLYFNESDGTTRKRIAIDIKKEEIYEAPRISLEGIYTIDGTVGMEATDKLIDTLDRYNVNEWENDYNISDSTDYEDGIGWSLWIQFEDGTVQKHEGNEEDLLPENFNQFSAELSDFVNEQLD